MQNDFRNDFLLFRLHRTLVTLGCDSVSQTRLIDWFWKMSRSWEAASQVEFDSIAISELTQQVKGSPLRGTPRGWWVSNHAPAPRSLHHQPSWTPCSHWGGSKADCPRCKNQLLPGAMLQAQAMYDEHRKFVLGRLHAELHSYQGHFNETLKSDLENEVWQTVAAKIGDYRDLGLKNGPLAWLRTIVEFTVKTHFQKTWAVKRGDVVTHELDEDNTRRVASPDDPPPARPVHPAGASPDDDRETAYGRSETVGRRMA